MPNDIQPRAESSAMGAKPSIHAPTNHVQSPDQAQRLEQIRREQQAVKAKQRDLLQKLPELGRNAEKYGSLTLLEIIKELPSSQELNTKELHGKSLTDTHQRKIKNDFEELNNAIRGLNYWYYLNGKDRFVTSYRKRVNNTLLTSVEASDAQRFIAKIIKLNKYRDDDIWDKAKTALAKNKKLGKIQQQRLEQLHAEAKGFRDFGLFSSKDLYGIYEYTIKFKEYVQLLKKSRKRELPQSEAGAKFYFDTLNELEQILTLRLQDMVTVMYHKRRVAVKYKKETLESGDIGQKGMSTHQAEFDDLLVSLDLAFKELFDKQATDLGKVFTPADHQADYDITFTLTSDLESKFKQAICGEYGTVQTKTLHSNLSWIGENEQLRLPLKYFEVNVLDLETAKYLPKTASVSDKVRAKRGAVEHKNKAKTEHVSEHQTSEKGDNSKKSEADIEPKNGVQSKKSLQFKEKTRTKKLTKGNFFTRWWGKWDKRRSDLILNTTVDPVTSSKPGKKKSITFRGTEITIGQAVALFNKNAATVKKYSAPIIYDAASLSDAKEKQENERELLLALPGGLPRESATPPSPAHFKQVCQANEDIKLLSTEIARVAKLYMPRWYNLPGIPGTSAYKTKNMVREWRSFAGKATEGSKKICVPEVLAQELSGYFLNDLRDLSDAVAKRFEYFDGSSLLNELNGHAYAIRQLGLQLDSIADTKDPNDEKVININNLTETIQFRSAAAIESLINDAKSRCKLFTNSKYWPLNWGKKRSKTRELFLTWNRELDNLLDGLNGTRQKLAQFIVDNIDDLFAKNYDDVKGEYTFSTDRFNQLASFINQFGTNECNKQFSEKLSDGALLQSRLNGKAFVHDFSLDSVTNAGGFNSIDSLREVRSENIHKFDSLIAKLNKTQMRSYAKKKLQKLKNKQQQTISDVVAVIQGDKYPKKSSVVKSWLTTIFDGDGKKAASAWETIRDEIVIPTWSYAAGNAESFINSCMQEKNVGNDLSAEGIIAEQRVRVSNVFKNLFGYFDHGKEPDLRDPDKTSSIPRKNKHEDVLDEKYVNAKIYTFVNVSKQDYTARKGSQKQTVNVLNGYLSNAREYAKGRYKGRNWHYARLITEISDPQAITDYGYRGLLFAMTAQTVAFKLDQSSALSVARPIIHLRKSVLAESITAQQFLKPDLQDAYDYLAANKHDLQRSNAVLTSFKRAIRSYVTNTFGDIEFSKSSQEFSGEAFYFGQSDQYADLVSQYGDSDSICSWGAVRFEFLTHSRSVSNQLHQAAEVELRSLRTPDNFAPPGMLTLPGHIFFLTHSNNDKLRNAMRETASRYVTANTGYDGSHTLFSEIMTAIDNGEVFEKEGVDTKINLVAEYGKRRFAHLFYNEKIFTNVDQQFLSENNTNQHLKINLSSTATAYAEEKYNGSHFYYARVLTKYASNEAVAKYGAKRLGHLLKNNEDYKLGCNYTDSDFDYNNDGSISYPDQQGLRFDQFVEQNNYKLEVIGELRSKLSELLSDDNSKEKKANLSRTGDGFWSSAAYTDLVKSIALTSDKPAGNDYLLLANYIAKRFNYLLTHHLPLESADQQLVRDFIGNKITRAGFIAATQGVVFDGKESAKHANLLLEIAYAKLSADGDAVLLPEAEIVKDERKIAYHAIAKYGQSRIEYTLKNPDELALREVQVGDGRDHDTQFFKRALSGEPFNEELDVNLIVAIKGHIKRNAAEIDKKGRTTEVRAMPAIATERLKRRGSVRGSLSRLNNRKTASASSILDAEDMLEVANELGDGVTGKGHLDELLKTFYQALGYPAISSAAHASLADLAKFTTSECVAEHKYIGQHEELYGFFNILGFANVSENNKILARYSATILKYQLDKVRQDNGRPAENLSTKAEAFLELLGANPAVKNIFAEIAVWHLQKINVLQWKNGVDQYSISRIPLDTWKYVQGGVFSFRLLQRFADSKFCEKVHLVTINALLKAYVQTDHQQQAVDAYLDALGRASTDDVNRAAGLSEAEALGAIVNPVVSEDQVDGATGSISELGGKSKLLHLFKYYTDTISYSWAYKLIIHLDNPSHVATNDLFKHYALSRDNARFQAWSGNIQEILEKRFERTIALDRVAETKNLTTLVANWKKTIKENWRECLFVYDDQKKDWYFYGPAKDNNHINGYVKELAANNVDLFKLIDQFLDENKGLLFSPSDEASHAESKKKALKHLKELLQHKHVDQYHFKYAEDFLADPVHALKLIEHYKLFNQDEIYHLRNIAQKAPHRVAAFYGTKLEAALNRIVEFLDELDLSVKSENKTGQKLLEVQQTGKQFACQLVYAHIFGTKVVAGKEQLEMVQLATYGDRVASSLSASERAKKALRDELQFPILGSQEKESFYHKMERYRHTYEFVTALRSCVETVQNDRVKFQGNAGHRMINAMFSKIDKDELFLSESRDESATDTETKDDETRKDFNIQQERMKASFRKKQLCAISFIGYLNSIPEKSLDDGLRLVIIQNFREIIFTRFTKLANKDGLCDSNLNKQLQALMDQSQERPRVIKQEINKLEEFLMELRSLTGGHFKTAKGAIKIADKIGLLLGPFYPGLQIVQKDSETSEWGLSGKLNALKHTQLFSSNYLGTLDNTFCDVICTIMDSNLNQADGMLVRALQALRRFVLDKKDNVVEQNALGEYIKLPVLNYTRDSDLQIINHFDCWAAKKAASDVGVQTSSVTSGSSSSGESSPTPSSSSPSSRSIVSTERSHGASTTAESIVDEVVLNASEATHELVGTLITSFADVRFLEDEDKVSLEQINQQYSDVCKKISERSKTVEETTTAFAARDYLYSQLKQYLTRKSKLNESVISSVSLRVGNFTYHKFNFGEKVRPSPYLAIVNSTDPAFPRDFALGLFKAALGDNAPYGLLLQRILLLEVGCVTNFALSKAELSDAIKYANQSPARKSELQQLFSRVKDQKDRFPYLANVLCDLDAIFANNTNIECDDLANCASLNHFRDQFATASAVVSKILNDCEAINSREAEEICNLFGWKLKGHTVERRAIEFIEKFFATPELATIDDKNALYFKLNGKTDQLSEQPAGFLRQNGLFYLLLLERCGDSDQQTHVMQQKLTTSKLTALVQQEVRLYFNADGEDPSSDRYQRYNTELNRIGGTRSDLQAKLNQHKNRNDETYKVLLEQYNTHDQGYSAAYKKLCKTMISDARKVACAYRMARFLAAGNDNGAVMLSASLKAKLEGLKRAYTKRFETNTKSADYRGSAYIETLLREIAKNESELKLTEVFIYTGLDIDQNNANYRYCRKVMTYFNLAGNMPSPKLEELKKQEGKLLSKINVVGGARSEADARALQECKVQLKEQGERAAMVVARVVKQVYDSNLSAKCQFSLKQQYNQLKQDYWKRCESGAIPNNYRGTDYVVTLLRGTAVLFHEKDEIERFIQRANQVAIHRGKAANDATSVGIFRDLYSQSHSPLLHATLSNTTGESSSEPLTAENLERLNSGTKKS